MLKALQRISTFLPTITEDTVVYSCSEYLEWVTPKIPLTNMVYRCDKTFHVLEENDTDVEMNVLIFDATFAEFYRVKSYNFVLLHRYSEDIGNKTRRGGSSSARIGRMFENRKQAYLNKIQELAGVHFAQEYVVVFTHANLKITLSPQKKVFTRTINTSNYNVNQIKVRLSEVIKEIDIDFEKTICERWYTEYTLNPDNYLINNEVVQSSKEAVIVADKVEDLEIPKHVRVYVIKGVTNAYRTTLFHLGGAIGV